LLATGLPLVSDVDLRPDLKIRFDGSEAMAVPGQSASEPASAAHQIAIDPLRATPLLDEGRSRTAHMLRRTAATLSSAPMCWGASPLRPMRPG
jgi:hypothetical protein